MKKLFTERNGGTKPRIAEVLDENTRKALLTLICGRMDEDWFGLSFPDKCADGYAYAGTDLRKLKATMDGYGVLWPRQVEDNNTLDGQIFDLVEFSYEYIAEANDPRFHSYMSHSHYSYDQESGREKFSHDINRIFERNGVAFNLDQGEVIRIAPAVLHDSLDQALFRSGDTILDDILENARQKFLNRSLEVRRESLEKLWDAWERLKTLEPGDKKTSTKVLLDKASPEMHFRDRLEQEARHLTEIGNQFMIRHMEIDKVPISDSAHIDYLFHRMFSMIWLLLKTSGR